ncbi:hypothetical protein ACGFK5_16595, partial [Micromonospora chersina]
MAKKMLGKLVAGAALGGASLLLFSPGAANAASADVLAKPQVSLPGTCSGEHEDWDHKNWDRKDWDRSYEDRKGHDGKDRDGKH